MTARLTHELDAPPWRRVDVTLMATAKTLRQAYDTALARVDLGFHEAVVLAYLAEQSAAISQAELARHLGFGRASTGVRIDQLEARGFVQREAHDSDRRVWQVTLTEAGRALAREVQRIDADLRERLREGIDDNERRLLADLLVKLQRNLAAMGGRERIRHSGHGPPTERSRNELR